MPLTIVETPGDAAANSYLSVAQADARLLAYEGFEKWSALDADSKARLLILGTRLVDQFPATQPQTAWQPKFATTQRLAFPRAEDGAGVIPEQVKNALADFVDHKVRGGMEGLKEMQAEGVRSIGVLGANATVDADPSGLPALARRELLSILAASMPENVVTSSDLLEDGPILG